MDKNIPMRTTNCSECTNVAYVIKTLKDGTVRGLCGFCGNKWRVIEENDN